MQRLALGSDDNDIDIEKQLALVQRLYDRTLAGTFDWRDVPSEGKVVADLDRFILELKAILDPDYPEEPDFRLAIVDKASEKEIDQITNQMLRPVMDNLSEEGLNPYNLMVDPSRVL